MVARRSGEGPRRGLRDASCTRQQLLCAALRAGRGGRGAAGPRGRGRAGDGAPAGRQTRAGRHATPSSRRSPPRAWPGSRSTTATTTRPSASTCGPCASLGLLATGVQRLPRHRQGEPARREHRRDARAGQIEAKASARGWPWCAREPSVLDAQLFGSVLRHAPRDHGPARDDPGVPRAHRALTRAPAGPRGPPGGRSRVRGHRCVRGVRPSDPRLPGHHPAGAAGRRRPAAADRRPRAADRPGRRRRRAVESVNVALVPLGTPLLAGPGAIVATMRVRPAVRQHAPTSLVALALGIVLVHVVLWLALRFAGRYPAASSATAGSSLVTRIAGLLLSAIAVQLVADARARPSSLRRDVTCVAMTGQDTLDGMPTRLFPARPPSSPPGSTARAASAYLDRPTPPKGPPWAHNSRRAPRCTTPCATGGCSPPDRRTPSAAAELVERSWTQRRLPRRRAVARVARARASDGSQLYVAGLDPDAEPLGVERTVVVPTARWPLSGRVDRIDAPARGGDELVVVDYKTGRRPLADDDARGRRSRWPCTSWRPPHAAPALPPRRAAPPADRQRRRREPRPAGPRPQGRRGGVDRARGPRRRRGIRAGDTGRPRSRPGPRRCVRWCDFRGVCAEGRAAAPQRHPWDAVLLGAGT